MNFRFTAILFGLVLVFGLVLLGLSLFSEPEPGTELLLAELGKAGVTPDQVDAVEITREPGGTLKLARTPDGWRITEPVQARANPAVVNAVIGELLKARPTAYPGLSGNPASHGLAPPSLRVTLAAGGGQSATVNLGNVTLGEDRAVAFVTTSARPSRPMAVRRAEVAALFREGAPQDTAGELAKWLPEYRSPTAFPTTPPENVNVVRLATPGHTLELARAGAGWKFVAPPWGPADAGASETPTPGTFTRVQGLIAALTSLRASPGPDPNQPAFIENPPDLAPYGLDPAHRIEAAITLKDGRVERVFLGAKIPPGPGQPPGMDDIYVQAEGDTGVMRCRTASREAVTGLLTNPRPLLDHTPLPADVHPEQVVAVDAEVIDHPAGKPAQASTVFVRRPPQQSGETPLARSWTLYGGPNDPQPVRSGGAGPFRQSDPVSQALQLLARRRLAKDTLPPDPKNPQAHDEFFGPTEVRAVLKLWTATEPVEPKSPVGAPPKGKGAPIVFQFGRTATEKVKQPDGKDIEQPTGVYVRRVLPDGTRTDFILPLKVGGAPAGPGAPPEPETDLLAAVSLRRTGLLDPTPPPDLRFSPLAAEKLTVTSGGVTVEATRTDTPGGPPTGTWTFTRSDQKTPARPADARTVIDMLGTLADLSSVMPPNPVAAEEPTPAQLKEWGLDPAAPRLKAVVTLKAAKPPESKDPKAAKDAKAPPAEQRVFYLGNEVSHAGEACVYVRQEPARPGGRAMALFVRKAAFERLASHDLRDRAVVEFDPSKVTRIALTGWYDANTGNPLRLEMQRKDGGAWERVQLPADFTLDVGGGKKTTVRQVAWTDIDPARVNGFLGDLLGIRAKQFVAGEPKPEHQFSWMQTPGGVQIELTVEGRKDPLGLNLGALTDGDADLFVWLSGLPKGEQIVTTQASHALREVKKGPVWFSRR